MLYLVITILCSTALILIFRLFSKWNVNVFQAIVFNYFTAAIIGLIIGGVNMPLADIPARPWFFSIFIFGIGYITTFTLLGISTQKVGITLATVAFKMSVVIPVIAAVFLYNDSMGLLKIAGIILACASIALVAIKKDKNELERKYLVFPVIVFFGCGMLDAFFKYVEHFYVSEEDASLFCSLAFLIAAFAGSLFLAGGIIAGRMKFEMKSIFAGILLGIPNYFSLYYFFKALRQYGDESSVIFPLNNMGIVAISALAAFFIFREKLSILNWAGIGLALVSIAMIAWA